MLSASQRNHCVTARPRSGGAGAMTPEERLAAEREAALVEARLRSGPPERRPAWGERSPLPLERSRRLTRPMAAAGYAFRGGTLAPGQGDDPPGHRSRRGLGARIESRSPTRSPSATCYPYDCDGNDHCPGLAATGPISASPGSRHGLDETRASGTARASRRPRSRSGRQRRRSGPTGGTGRSADDQGAYVRRLECQVAELRDTMSLLADVNTREVEELAWRRRTAATRQSGRAPGGRRRRPSGGDTFGRGGHSGSPGRASGRMPVTKGAFAGRVSDAIAESRAHARVASAIDKETERSQGREEALRRRQALAEAEAAAAEADEAEEATQQPRAELAGGHDEDQAEDKQSRRRQQQKQTGPSGGDGDADEDKDDDEGGDGYGSESEETGAETIARRRFEEEKRRLEEEETAMRRWRFRAKPVPRSTREALYDKVVSQAATRRRLHHEARLEELESTMKPFERMEAGDRRRREEQARRRREREEAEERQLRQAARFRANPVPVTTREPDEESRARQERDAMRTERVAHRALTLLSNAALPPRMELRKEEEAAKARQAAVEKRRAEAEAARQNRIRPTPLPDFERLHGKFVRALRTSKTARAPTAPEPFSFDSEQRRAEEAARAEARRAEEEERLAKMMSRPVPHSSGGGGGGGGGGAREARLLQELRSTVSGGAGSDPGAMTGTRLAATMGEGGFRVTMTRAAELRIEARQRAIRERQAAEAAAARKEEELARRQKETDRLVRPVVLRLEQQRRPTPLAWQLDDDTPEARERRRADRLAAQAKREELAAGVAKAVERREMLFLRGSVDKERGEAERRALLRVAGSVADGAASSHGGGAASRGAAWHEMETTGGIAGQRDILFSEEERSALGGGAASTGDDDE
ncbi:hypothetical protein FNF29_02969 [Cafeteria roenbergensis]|uniref:Uncharacterized protein n=1 Tax=Cafeteria roenbergensis TaxID=33653 RepID=A0A5A8CP98_CAFRO|nr:hypothetical protein FNF29_02969 [Cafeteria roenbergensis]|eukprot:KAA0153581.1 hypothetical protein FNF29_02969 [Cafeteria roenbergensis]